MRRSAGVKPLHPRRSPKPARRPNPAPSLERSPNLAPGEQVARHARLRVPRRFHGVQRLKPPRKPGVILLLVVLREVCRPTSARLSGDSALPALPGARAPA